MTGTAGDTGYTGDRERAIVKAGASAAALLCAAGIFTVAIRQSGPGDLLSGSRAASGPDVGSLASATGGSTPQGGSASTASAVTPLPLAAGALGAAVAGSAPTTGHPASSGSSSTTTRPPSAPGPTTTTQPPSPLPSLPVPTTLPLPPLPGSPTVTTVPSGGGLLGGGGSASTTPTTAGGLLGTTTTLATTVTVPPPVSSVVTTTSTTLASVGVGTPVGGAQATVGTGTAPVQAGSTAPSSSPVPVSLAGGLLP